jgi:hypothetical protein
VSIRGRKELGQNATMGKELGRHAPPPPGIQEIVAKRMKIGWLGSIRACTHLCIQKKAKGMLRGIRNDGTKRRLRGGFSSDQPRET